MLTCKVLVMGIQYNTCDVPVIGIQNLHPWGTGDQYSTFTSVSYLLVTVTVKLLSPVDNNNQILCEMM